MQIYETVLVAHPRLSDTEIAKFSDDTKNLISAGGGEIISEDKWGRRKLAYPIGKVREGFYLYFKFRAAGTLIQKMNKHYRLQENLLRTLTVVMQKPKRMKIKTPKPAKTTAAATTAPAAAQPRTPAASK